MRAFVVLGLLLGGCASSTVDLLDGEGSRPGGAVVVLDPRTGEDVRIVDTANSRVSLSGARARVRPVPAKSAARYRDLLGYLPEPSRRFILYFPLGSAELRPESLPTRAALLAEVERRGPGVDVQIEGHTDTLGNADDNDRLSAERAAAARDMLVALGLEAAVTRVVGRGEREPVAGHETADGTADPVNRRVEVVVR